MNSPLSISQRLATFMPPLTAVVTNCKRHDTAHTGLLLMLVEPSVAHTLKWRVKMSVCTVHSTIVLEAATGSRFPHPWQPRQRMLRTEWIAG